MSDLHEEAGEVMPTNVHDCPMCAMQGVPVWRAVCGKCYSLLPAKVRSDYSRAYRSRVLDPASWQEMRITWRRWYLERGVEGQWR